MVKARMTFRERVIAGVIASVLAIAILGPCGIMDDPEKVESRCAREVGVEWSQEQGVTERLDAFRDCVTERRG